MEKELLKNLPQRPLSRDEFNKLETSAYGETDGHKWGLSYNYECEGPYGPEQRVTVLNVTLTVWSPRSLNTATRSLDRDGDFEAAFEDARRELDEACDHPNAREMSSEEARAAGMFVGRCYHNYECPHCGARFGVDSSD
jgi:hypothetical protein